MALDPTTVEALYAVGAGGRLVGASTYTDYPPAARLLPTVNGLDPSREALAGLRPDLIMISDQLMTVQAADAKAKLLGAPLFVSTSGSYTAVEQKIAQYGAYFGSPAPTRATIAQMRRTLADVQRRVAGRRRPTVFDIVWTKPLMTAGRGSFISNLIWLAGGRDAAADAPPYSQYPPEALIAANPDVVITSTDGIAAARAALGGLHLRALSSNGLHGVPDDLVTRSGPRLAQGLLLIARILHPEAFASR